MAAGLKGVGFTPNQGPSDNDKFEPIRRQIGTDFTQDKLKGAGHKRNEMGKDDFLKLMTAQLKYQDPISPLKNEEMAAQLAQFSALEQMSNVNQNLEKMQDQAKPQENILAASLIGKKIGTDSSNFLYDKVNQAQLKFELLGDSQVAQITVFNEKGEAVRELAATGLKKGPQKVMWDGKSDKGAELAKGQYTFKVIAKDQTEKSVKAKTETNGVVSGVSFEGGKAILLVGDQKVPFDSIGKIEDAAMANQAAMNQAAAKKSPQEYSEVAKEGQKVDDQTEKRTAEKLAADKNLSIEKADDLVPENLRNNLPNQNVREKINKDSEQKPIAAANAKVIEASADEDEEVKNNYMGLWNPDNL